MMWAEPGPPRPLLEAALTREEVPGSALAHAFSAQGDGDRSGVFIVLHGQLQIDARRK